MSRSSKKGAYVHERLYDRIVEMNKNDRKEVIRVWSRASTIFPEFIGHTIAVHDGRKHVPIYITEDMVGHKLGEFVLTRTFRGHRNPDKVTKTKDTAGIAGLSAAAPAAAAALAPTESAAAAESAAPASSEE